MAKKAKHIKFVTKERNEFEVPVELTECMQTIDKMITVCNNGDESVIHLTQISSLTFKYIIKWAIHHVDDVSKTNGIDKFFGKMKTSHVETKVALNETRDYDDPMDTGDDFIKPMDSFIEEALDLVATTELADVDKLLAFLSDWDSNYLLSMTIPLLFDVMCAANFLNIRLLVDQTCLYLAHKIKGKTTDEIRKLFGISSKFTAQQKNEMQRENDW